MVVVGCDVGSCTGKVIIIKDDEIVGSGIVLRRLDTMATAGAAMSQALYHTRLSLGDVKWWWTQAGKSRDPLRQ